MSKDKAGLMIDDPERLSLEEARHLMTISRRVANKGTFEVSRLHVKQIWDIMREALTQDRRDGRDYTILFHRGCTYQREPSKEEFFEGAYRDDPWMNRVRIHRMKITSSLSVVLFTHRRKNASRMVLLTLSIRLMAMHSLV
ncbi:MAG: hypothetical protein PHD48_01555 [Alphaproteobacteria bacterium]|nr:hypothetical protein [Alphaproteobacteria bacterium]